MNILLLYICKYGIYIDMVIITQLQAKECQIKDDCEVDKA